VVLLVARANRDEAHYRACLLRRHPDGRALADHWQARLIELPAWARTEPIDAVSASDAEPVGGTR
jgi:hypothetical protein